MSTNNTRPLIIYHSETGNTLPVAEAMAEAIGAERLIAGKVTGQQVQDRPLIGLGSGIYYMKHHRDLYAVIGRLPAGSRVFTFTTSGVKLGGFVRFYQRRLAKRLVAQGAQVVGQWYCPGYDQQPLMKPLGINKGRPDSRDCASATEFARSLLQ